MYLAHLKLYGWYEQYGKCSYIISGFLRLFMSSYSMCPYVFVYFIVHAFGLSIVASL